MKADARMTHCEMKCCTNKENISLYIHYPVNTYGGVTEYLHEFLTSALGSNKQSTSRPGLSSPHGKGYWYCLDRKLLGHKARLDATAVGTCLSTNRNRIHVP
jgi:hypothetical protein